MCECKKIVIFTEFKILELALTVFPGGISWNIVYTWRDPYPTFSGSPRPFSHTLSYIVFWFWNTAFILYCSIYWTRIFFFSLGRFSIFEWVRLLSLASVYGDQDRDNWRRMQKMSDVRGIIEREIQNERVVCLHHSVNKNGQHHHRSSLIITFLAIASTRTSLLSSLRVK